MPLYEYRCSKCEKKIEVIRKFSDPPLTEHEGCGGTLEQLLSAPAFQLKGTGWYVTDYGRGGSKPAGNGSPAKTESTSPAKTESKPAAKPDAPKSSSSDK